MKAAPAHAVKIALAALSALISASAARAQCTVQTLAELPVTMVGARPLVPVRINGLDGAMLLDTGAFYSVLAPAEVERLGLRTRFDRGFSVEGVGGGVLADYTVVRHFAVGGRAFDGLPFLVVEGAGPGAAGILGQNILVNEDVEFDLANGVARLVRPKGCGPADSLAYWAGGKASVLDMAPRDRRRDIMMSAFASLDGQRIRVQFDSGAAASGLTTAAAARAGVTPQTPGVAPGPGNAGIGAKVAQSWIGPFRDFSIGGETVRNTRLGFGDSDLGDSDMVLGVDFFLSHRIYVSRAQQKVYFTYNGGPVFRLDQAQASAAPPADVTAQAPTGAGGFVRRGAAFLARRQFDLAVADFTQAIRLEPKAADLYFDRATAHALARRPDLAMADFDVGLKLKPDDASAVLARAALRLEAHDPAKARVDLDAAAKARGGDPVLGLQIANLYAQADDFGEAVVQYDRWIRANESDGQRADALDGRCRARTLARRNLDLALKDCDLAVRLRPGDARLLGDRGLVRLARGEWEQTIADDSAALRLNPGAAEALYGRGIAELKLGRAGGEADLQAGRSRDPQGMARLERLGFGR